MRIMLVMLALATFASPSPVLSRSLTVVSWGGPFQTAQNKLVFRPFTELTKINMTNLSWEGGVAALSGKSDNGNAAWDAVMVNAEDLIPGCESGLFQKLDWALLGGRERYLKEAVSDCGVGAIVYSLVLAYDGEKQKIVPKSWADFWDQRKYPGKRALRRGPKANLEFALMADGVKPAEVYKILSTPEGVDRAFKKLDQLRPSLLWWENASQPAQMLGAGQVVMAAAYNTRLVRANRVERMKLKWTWTNSLSTIDFWTILKVAPNKSEAEQFLAYASAPHVQAQMAREMPYGVTRKEAAEETADLDLASSPENIRTALFVDEKFWMQNQEKLNQRFITWVSK